MSWTADDIATLKAAIATGARKVTFGAGPDARTVEYRSLAEMESILAKVEAEVIPNSAAPTQWVGAYNSNLS